MKPGLHAHVKLPGVLVHTAFVSQLSVSKAHSSSSSMGSKYQQSGSYRTLMHYKKKTSEETQMNSIFQYVRTYSSSCVYTSFDCSNTECISLPKQLIPSPVKPGLHAHVKLPGVLVHTAFVSQLSVSKAHSSSSSIGSKYQQ